ncbi:MAG: tetratricopeptide repeat protein, partial [Candidatus Hermodarchaeota archaeon]
IGLEPSDLNLYYQKLRILIYFNQYRDALDYLMELLERFPESEKDLKILKATVLRRMQNVEDGLEIINELITNYPNDNDLICYKAYWLQYLDDREGALNLIQKLTKKEPNNGLYQDTYGEILMYFENYEEAVNKFLKAMVLGSNDWYIYQTYIKLGICYQTLEKYDLALKNLDEGKKLAKKSTLDAETEQKWLAIADLFLTKAKE